MIALETTAKIGKSPKKPQVELREESDEDEEESEEESDEGTNESEVRELESADEGLGENESDDDVEVKSESDEEDDSSDSKPRGNPGWADVMQKILRSNKPKRKKTVVLSKAKKLCDVVKKEKEEELSFELEGVKEEVKTEEAESVDGSKEKPIASVKHRRKDNLGIRVKPSITERERERMLQKIATKGVVQLFNAVKQQQTEINKKLSEAGPLERKREQVMKSIDKKAFLDVLMGGTKSVAVDNEVKDEMQENDKAVNKKKDDKVWSVLREDFGMGAKLKDWDRKDGDDDSSAAEDMDSDE